MTEPAKDEAELIEAIALALWEFGCSDDGAAKATLAAIRAAGWAVVPVEPTEAMLWAADRAPAPEFERENPDYLQFFLLALMRARWAAMIAAAPGQKP
jgi:hypothetical protein